MNKNTDPSIFDIEKTLQTMAGELTTLVQQRQIDLQHLTVVGIRTGGVWIAERLHKLMNLSTQLGFLDISFYRDDFTRLGLNPEVKPSSLPLDLDDRHVILVDDVLHTGRTIRAALNELFDYGRPASILLAVLIKRSGQELPIAPDVFGKLMDLREGEQIKLSGPEPLELAMVKSAR